MPLEEPATARPSLRQRRRAAAVQEVVDAAEQHITEHGPAALSLRAIAQSLGMTVQALYRYFPNRDALITVLIAKAYEDLAGALQAAVDSAEDTPAAPPLMVVAESYRGWAIEHPELFQLLYGTPLRHYTAPTEGPTTQAVRRISGLFGRALFDGYTAEQFSAADMPELSAGFRKFTDGLPPGSRGNCLPRRQRCSWAHGAACTVSSPWRCSGTPRSSATTRKRSSAWRCRTSTRTSASGFRPPGASRRRRRPRAPVTVKDLLPLTGEVVHGRLDGAHDRCPCV